MNAIERNICQMLIGQRIKHGQLVHRHILACLAVQFAHVCQELALLHLVLKIIFLPEQRLVKNVSLTHRRQARWRAKVNTLHVAQLLAKLEIIPPRSVASRCSCGLPIGTDLGLSQVADVFVDNGIAFRLSLATEVLLDGVKFQVSLLLDSLQLLNPR